MNYLIHKTMDIYSILDLKPNSAFYACGRTNVISNNMRYVVRVNE